MSLAATAAAAPPSRPIKILMLHGYTQSGPLFQAKTGALRKTLSKAFPAGIELVYPTAPIRLTPADESFLAGTGTARDADTNATDAAQHKTQLDAWAWWRRKSIRANPVADGNGDANANTHTEPFIYEGIEDGLASLAAVLAAEGPFDGVIGFSQGAAAAAMLASLLEPGRRAAFDARSRSGGIPYPACFRAAGDHQMPCGSDAAASDPAAAAAIHPPLRFAVAYSGFAASGSSSSSSSSDGDESSNSSSNTPYAAFYEPEIQTPMLHFLGSQDVVVEEKRSLALVRACARRDPRYVVYHPGGHFLPSTQKASVNALVAFIREVMMGEEGGEARSEARI